MLLEKQFKEREESKNRTSALDEVLKKMADSS
jgi:hypothetical protein